MQEAITWVKVDPDMRCLMVSLGCNDLKYVYVLYANVRLRFGQTHIVCQAVCHLYPLAGWHTPVQKLWYFFRLAWIPTS